METGEGDKVDGEFPEVRVELTGETEAAGHTVEGLVVNAHDLIGVLDELMHGEGGVVGLDDGVGDLGGGHDGEGHHHSVGVLLTDLRDEESSHSGSSATTERVGDLEALKAIAALSLLADNIEDGVNELSTPH